MSRPITHLFRSLGFLSRSLFANQAAGEHFVLLDGVAGSFALSQVDAPAKGDDSHFYNWAWSSHVPCHVEIAGDEDDGVAFLRRWDDPSRIRRYTLRSIVNFAPRFVAELESIGEPRTRSSVNYSLRIFDELRNQLRTFETDTRVVRVFHSLLVSAAKARRDDAVAKRLLTARTVREAVADSGTKWQSDSDELLDQRIHGITSALLSPDPATGRLLEPSLLLRHAGGTLYQRAHIELARHELQLPLLGVNKNVLNREAELRAIVYTPPSLARALATRALTLWQEGADSTTTEQSEPIRIMDPACGSGVFLVEAFLAHDEDEKLKAVKVELAGFDLSAKASLMSEFALEDALSDFPPSARPKIVLASADMLSGTWPMADIILMNPPFVAWEDLSEKQRPEVQEIVSSVAHGESRGRPDLAMAFVIKAIKALRPGGVLATVVPSAFLGTESGRPWRDWIQAECRIDLVARFIGHDVFPTAMSEASVLVLQRPPYRKQPTTVLLAKPGHGDQAVRALRQIPLAERDSGGFELYLDPGAVRSGASWLPQERAFRRLATSAESKGLPLVSELFRVRQGARTGANKVFVLDERAFREIPELEKGFFRRLAGNNTIHGGFLERNAWVFFPYSHNGSMIADEIQLSKSVPYYFEHYLAPAKAELQSRAKIGDRWWELTWPRGWQFAREPKLISSYFGSPGKFAFDATGEYVVGQGFAWQSKKANASVDALMAYLALFNSKRFFAVMSNYSFPVQGGQLDLSPRFVDRVPVPDFFTAAPTTWTAVAALAEVGRRIHAEGSRNVDCEELVGRVYGIPESDWPRGA